MDLKPNLDSLFLYRLFSFLGSNEIKSAQELYESAMKIWTKDPSKENWVLYNMAHIHLIQTFHLVKNQWVTFVFFCLLVLIDLLNKYLG